jgi:hypothetical protein
MSLQASEAIADCIEGLRGLFTPKQIIEGLREVADAEEEDAK